MANPLFTEIQKYRAKWFWTLNVGLLIFIGYIFIKHVILGYTFQGEPAPVMDFTIKLLTIIAVIVVFLVLKLTTIVDDSGLHYQMFPLHLAPKTIKWEEVESCAITDIANAKGFSAWGLSFTGKKNPSYVLVGTKAVEVTFKSGKKLLLGSPKAEELVEIINQKL